MRNKNALKDGRFNNRVSRSLSARLRVVLLGIILMVILSFILSIYLISREERKDYEIRQSENLLNGLSNSIQSNMKGYLELSRRIMVDDRLVTFLRAETESVDSGIINDARYGVLDILNVTSNVDSVVVIREDMNLMDTNRAAYRYDYDKMSQDLWKEDILEGLGKADIFINGNNTMVRLDGSAVLTIGRAIYDLNSQKRTGILLMNISNAMLEGIINSLYHDEICILATDGTFLAGDASLMQYFCDDFLSEEVVHKERRKGSGKVLVSGCRVSDMPVVIMCANRMGTVEIPFEMGYVLLFLLLEFMLSVFAVGMFVSGNITNPVSDLISAMEKNKESGRLEKIDLDIPRNEIYMLEESYNSMVEHMNDLFGRLIEKEKTIQKAEMRVLHEQIKPHFLYNSLETIGFLAMDAGAENVYSALETLGSFYRNFLSKGDREISLRREILIVQDYLSIQKLRYGDAFYDEYDIEEATGEWMVPKLLLQHLVENSIYHGIRLKGESGVIRISSRMVSGNLHILVRDTGVGMPREKIDQVLFSDKECREDGSGEPSESFGLWGTVERIRYFCDRDDVVRIRSEIGEYTEIEIVIPQAKIKRVHEQNV